jgi:hypothetical protein
VKLDLLYEVDVPKPWDGPGTQGQRRSEQHAYAEALEQIELADRSLICHVQFGTIPHDAVMHGIELLGTQVIPELEDYAADRAGRRA